jgi:hypothetical protein
LNDFESAYDIRLSKCNLLPLSLRREFLDCVLLYNYIHNLSDVKINVNFVEYNHGQLTRRQQDELMLIHKPFNTLKYGKLYTNRIIKVWNKIPYDIRNIDLSDAGYNRPFKTKLKEWINVYFTQNFDVNNSCTWLLHCGCPLCQIV